LVELVKNLDRLVKEKSGDQSSREGLLLGSYRNANRLLDTLNELLDFLLLESGRFSLNLKKSDLVNVIKDVVQTYRDQAEAKYVSLATATMDRSLVASVDPVRMRLVLCNLVENAITFSEPGGKVLITGKAMNEKLIINVIDEGCGISLSDCSRIFEKYFQVSHVPKKSTSGLGLGLYVARLIIEAHGGTISVDSQLGTGSTFTLIIPVMKS
jgi:signal transduction histidine kinase